MERATRGVRPRHDGDMAISVTFLCVVDYFLCAPWSLMAFYYLHYFVVLFTGPFCFLVHAARLSFFLLPFFAPQYVSSCYFPSHFCLLHTLV